MSSSQIIFLGAGKANVVVDLPLADILSAPSSLRTSAPAQRAALRIRSVAHRECAECYRTLKAYAGSRHVVPLEPALYQAIEAVVPLKHLKLIEGASEATIVPNFTSDPAQVLQRDVAAGDESGRVADYTVEVKPKSAWRQPQIVGIVVDGVTYWIEEAKHRHCRYAQMLCYKEARDGKGEDVANLVVSSPIATTGDNNTKVATAAEQGSLSVHGPYCPNYLFCPSLSSREGLQRLMYSPQNNLKVISYHLSRTTSSQSDNPSTLTVAELHGIADAIDASGVLAPLSHLQLCGCAPPTDHESAAVVAAKQIPVLDVDLLYRWILAKDKDTVEWIVLPGVQTPQCSCTAPETKNRALNLAEARRMRPMLDLQTCVERFFVSTTAKDVSLMVAVSSRCGEPDTSIPCSRLKGVPAEVGGVFVQRGVVIYRVGVVDLDDKRHKPLDYYYRHDKEIVEAFLKRGSNCVDRATSGA